MLMRSQVVWDVTPFHNLYRHFETGQTLWSRSVNISEGFVFRVGPGMLYQFSNWEGLCGFEPSKIFFTSGKQRVSLVNVCNEIHFHITEFYDACERSSNNPIAVSLHREVN